MLEIAESSTVAMRFILALVGISVFGNFVADRAFHLAAHRAFIPRFFIGICVGYGASCLVLNIFYRITKNFALAWLMYLALLFLFLIVSARTQLSEWWNRRSKEDLPLNLTVFVLGLVAALLSVIVWCSTVHLGMGHSEKYRMFSTLFLWESKSVDLSQHYASTLMTAGFHLSTGAAIDLTNWISHIVLKVGLLFLVHSSVLAWSGANRLLAWFATLCFGLVSGSFSLSLIDYIDSGGPVLMMTYPDRILGFVVLFLWMHWLNHTWKARKTEPTRAGARLLEFVFVWASVCAFVAISAEDLLLLLGIAFTIVGAVLVRDLIQNEAAQQVAKVAAKALAFCFCILYVLTTQGGMLTHRANRSEGRALLTHSQSIGQHQVKVHSKMSFREVPGIWYRIYPTSRDASCHLFESFYGWPAVWHLFRITGLGMLAFLLLAAFHYSKILPSTLFNAEHFGFRFSFLTLLFPGMALALWFEDAAGYETVSRFHQWALFLSFLFVGYLVHALWSKAKALRPLAILLLMVTCFPMAEYATRPLMVERFQAIPLLYTGLFQEEGIVE
jgi:hypothetical protein